MRVGIMGYGNLGRGVAAAVMASADMELAAVFTRRDPETVEAACPDAVVADARQILLWKDKIDVLFLCGGSATDLPHMTPDLARHFNVVDSYDNHSNIPNHYRAVDAAAREGGRTALICCGWDPGMFSLNRLYAGCILPQGRDYTFWGKGVSQGHSDAIRRIPGVADARQYTVPVEQAMAQVRRGENPLLTTRQKHTRECFVVLEPGADPDAVRQAIVTMPGYFADYDTSVTFLSQQELDESHSALPHGGSVIRTGTTGKGSKQVIEYHLELESNPEFTGAVLTCFGRAVKRIADRGETGCKTVFDVAPVDLSPVPREELMAHLL